MTSLHIHLLGDFYMEYDGELVTAVDSTRLQSLLAYLLLHSHALQPRHHIAFCLWPDSSERQARNNLRKTLHQLRHSLPQPLPEADDPYDHWLRIDGRTVQWRPDVAYTLDVTEFETRFSQASDASRDDHAALQTILEETVALYRGELLPSCYDEWIGPVRERLRQTFMEALERLIWVAEDRRDYYYNETCHSEQ